MYTKIDSDIEQQIQILADFVAQKVARPLLSAEKNKLHRKLSKGLKDVFKHLFQRIKAQIIDSIDKLIQKGSLSDNIDEMKSDSIENSYNRQFSSQKLTEKQTEAITPCQLPLYRDGLTADMTAFCYYFMHTSSGKREKIWKFIKLSIFHQNEDKTICIYSPYDSICPTETFRIRSIVCIELFADPTDTPSSKYLLLADNESIWRYFTFYTESVTLAWFHYVANIVQTVDKTRSKLI
ncbi:hypothetical protein RF11_02662 [Thelohanellus kitauei]|uniref:Uncharacterized protein n=1 Tax=Thelohanellus kitauei TaxID=669202 RepID=A0A0C2M3N7_THEKT|nr:hypothetical protein RF11_02662 [Thelohanellus kitauei]